METIKIWFADFWPEWNDENFITPILEKRFKVVLDEHDPDVLFHSIFNSIKDAPKYKCKKILFLGENYRAIKFDSDYTISFDPHTETNYRLPLWQVFLLLKPELKERLYNRLNYDEEEFERWCAFLVSNPNNFMRNSAYQYLNNYKHVHSYGKVLTNDFSLQNIVKDGRYWRDIKDEFFLKTSHKFMITYENTPHRYYCTEKLMDAFLVGAMPIYWGDPRVGEDWNEKAFINVTKQYLEAVKKADQDKKMFREMYEEPVFTDEQKKKHEGNMSNFEEWLIEKIKL